MTQCLSQAVELLRQTSTRRLPPLNTPRASPGPHLTFSVEKAPCAGRVADFGAFDGRGLSCRWTSRTAMYQGRFQLHRGTLRGRGLPSEARAKLWPPRASGAARDAPSCDNPAIPLAGPLTDSSLSTLAFPTLLRNILATLLMGIEKYGVENRLSTRRHSGYSKRPSSFPGVSQPRRQLDRAVGAT